MEMDFTDLPHHAVREHLRPGEIAIDATVGNGHDAKFLANVVGPSGHVFGFDVQPIAIVRAGRLLADAGIQNVKLLMWNHANMADKFAELHGRVGAVMFNLGYLPRGDRSIVTAASSTVRACDGAMSLLRPGGVLTVLAYRGHPGGREEADAVRAYLRAFAVEVTAASEAGTSPVLFVVRKRHTFSVVTAP